MEKCKLSIIIPILNESDNLRPLTKDIIANIDDTCIPFEIIFVDDNSKDNTENILKQIQKETTEVRAFVRLGEKSLSASVNEGYLKSRGEIILVMDGDQQHNPKYIKTLLAHIENGADLCIGSRYALGGTSFQENSTRKYISLITTIVTKKVLGLSINDPLSGYFACKREVIASCQKKLSGMGFKILLEIIFHNRSRLITEIPIHFKDRSEGSSKANFLTFYQFLCQIVALVSRIKSVQFVSFCLIGTLGLISHLIILNIIFSITDVFLASHALAFLAATTQNYFLNKRLTFRKKHNTSSFEFSSLFKYLFANAISFFANTGIATILYSNFYLLNLSSLFGIIIGIAWNYYAAKIILNK